MKKHIELITGLVWTALGLVGTVAMGYATYKDWQAEQTQAENSNDAPQIVVPE